MTEKLTAAVHRAYPRASEILVSFPERWELVETFYLPHRERTHPLYVAAMPPERERPTRNHFAGLTPEINLSLASYRLYRFFQPWPMPTLVVHWNSSLGQGRVLGQKEWKVQLQDMGDAQAWTGREYGVLWECFLHSRMREGERQIEPLAQVWQAVEQNMKVKTIFTPDHEPTMEPELYRDFLERMGYAPEPASPRWWRKRIG